MARSQRERPLKKIDFIFYSLKQEIIKVREWIPHIGPLTKEIPPKLFLDIVLSFFANITRALRGCFRGGSVYVSFRFVSKQGKPFNAVEMSFLIFWLRAKDRRSRYVSKFNYEIK